MNIETIAQKISRIIAKADSTTHDEEAEVFMAKAQQMMIDHGLSLLDLGRLDAEDPVGIFEDFYNNASDGWQLKAGNSLAIYYGCKMIQASGHTKSATKWVVFGRESARITFSLMWPFVDRQVKNFARESVRLGHHKTYSVAKTRIGNSLALRLSKMNAENRKNNAGAARGLNALVPVDIIELAVQDRFPMGTSSSRSAGVKTDSISRKFASRVSITNQASDHRAPLSRRISG